MLPLTKMLHPGDYDELGDELLLVDAEFDSERPQHPARRWEYAMALRALGQWMPPGEAFGARKVADVGGAGSPFYRMFVAGSVRVIDPDGPDPRYRMPLADYVRTNPRLMDAVFCLSVIEHVEDVDEFLYHLCSIVAPGGLLFLTMDCCGCEEKDEWRLRHVLPDDADKHHYHWMRKRMFTRSSWEYLFLNVKPYGFELFGDADWAFHGHHVYDYTFASLAMRKR